MNTTSKNTSVSVIVAHRGPDHHLLGVIKDLKMWFSEVTVVGPSSDAVSHVIKTHGGKWIQSESSSIYELWEMGIQSQTSSWYLLLEGREYLSTILKENILEATKSAPDQKTWFSINRKIFFLKQRLKYSLEWTHDPRSGLLFVGIEKKSILNSPSVSSNKKSLEGDSVYFSEDTISEVITNTIQRSDHAADQLYQANPELSSYNLFLKALIFPPTYFLKTWIGRRAMREGFAGFLFSFMESLTVLLGFLRYFEKYIRSGRQIKGKLNTIKKILIIKLRGMGDAVIATAVIRNIGNLMPNISISILTPKFCKPIFENNPHLDSVYGLSVEPDKTEISKITHQLSQKKFDVILNLHARNLSSRLAQKIKARWCISRSYFMREKFTSVMLGSDHSLNKASIEEDLDCIRAIGLDPIDKITELFLTNEETAWAKQYLSRVGVDIRKKMVTVHPAVSQSIRHWGMDRFVSLSQKLTTNYDCQVVGIFSNKEQSIADVFNEQVKGAFVYVGPLRESISLINEADLMIDNSSGPAQVSVALKTPTLVLVGPDYENTYHEKSTYDKNHYVFYKEVPCRDLFFSKCLTPETCKNLVCLDHSVDEVIEKSLKLLSP